MSRANTKLNMNLKCELAFDCLSVSAMRLTEVGRHAVLCGSPVIYNGSASSRKFSKVPSFSFHDTNYEPLLAFSSCNNYTRYFSMG